MQFKKAVKYETRGRVALVGPAGSGKSFTMLTLARKLAGPNGKIAAIDTEHGSLSKYADLFEFDVIELDSFSPENFQGALDAAERERYAVFCCDSLSHFWVGKDGALEYVDTRAKRNNGDSFSGWKDFRPHERAMVDRLIASPCHVIVTMRTKNEYVTEKNDRGKTVRRKIGLAPVQREGMEYEFDLVGTLDDDNTLVIDKTRCPAYAGKALAKPQAKDFQAFEDWLKGESAPAAGTPGPRSAVPPPAVPAPPAAPARAAAVPPEIDALWQRMGTAFATIVGEFSALKKDLLELAGNDVPYYQILAKHGMKHANDKGLKLGVYRACARELFEYVQHLKAEPPIEEPTDTAPEAQEVAA